MKVSRRLKLAVRIVPLLIPALATAVITGCSDASPIEDVEQVHVRPSPPRWLHGTWLAPSWAEDLILRFASNEVIVRFGELAKQFSPVDRDRSITLTGSDLVRVGQDEDPYTLKYSSGGTDYFFKFNRVRGNANVMVMVNNPGLTIDFLRYLPRSEEPDPIPDDPPPHAPTDPEPNADQLGLPGWIHGRWNSPDEKPSRVPFYYDYEFTRDTLTMHVTDTDSTPFEHLSGYIFGRLDPTDNYVYEFHFDPDGPDRDEYFSYIYEFTCRSRTDPCTAMQLSVTTFGEGGQQSGGGVGPITLTKQWP